MGSLNVNAGGIHRITKMLMDRLTLLGYRCLYAANDWNTDTYYKNGDFSEENRLTIPAFRQYLLDEKVDVIIDQQGVFSDNLARQLQQINLPNLKSVTVYHNTPQIFEKTLTFERVWHNGVNSVTLKGKLSCFARCTIFPLWKWYIKRGVAKKYRNNYDTFDRCIMLSRGDMQVLSDYIGMKNLTKCVVINNPLVFDNIADESCLKEKKNEVLVVSRLNNFEKRLDRVLKIWRILQDRGLVDDWHLTIVGWGLQEKMLHDMTCDLQLKNVTFTGRQESEPYYKPASLFMLTSAVEGWGLTLTESMQTGTVPLAMDTYPALKDIITDGYDGCIIKKDDLAGYADRMEMLMTNKEEREKIAKNGLKSCKRFTKDKIIQKWVDMLESL